MPEPESPHEAEIRALWERAGRTLCAGDWSGYREVWAHSEHIELIHPDGSDWRVGWREIGAAYRDLLASGFRCESETRALRVHVSPAGEMAWATAEVVVRAGEPRTERTLWETLVFERRDGAWRLVHGHASVPRPPEE